MTINIGSVESGRDTNVTSNTTYVQDVLGAAESKDLEKAEGILSTIPADAIDVVLGALESPLKALGVVVKKIAGKIKLEHANDK